jgi:hypothetical protein
MRPAPPRPLRREGWWMAGLLACGEGAAISHHSAATLWDLRLAAVLPASVIAPGDRGRKHARIAAHRMRLHPAETIDLAATLGARAPRETVERAHDLRRFTPTRSRPGSRASPGDRAPARCPT